MTEYKIPLTKDGGVDYREMSYRPVSSMLDNPDEYGIYPTTKCYQQLDDNMKALVAHVVEEAAKVVEKTSRIDNQHLPAGTVLLEASHAIRALKELSDDT